MVNGFEMRKARFAQGLAESTKQDDDSVYVPLGNWLHWRGLADQAQPIADAVRQIGIGRTLTPQLLRQMEDRLRSKLLRLYDIAALREMPLGIHCDHDGIGNVRPAVKVTTHDAGLMDQAGYVDDRR